jgi:non-specific serine/threonine protein kinase
MSLASGTRLGHFEILAPLGAGGMGEVYRARDERLHREVALKVLPAGTVADDHARRRFRTEALALSKVNHPNIASIYELDSQDGVDFLIMELVDGETLASKISSAPLPEKDLTGLALQIGEALREAHERGIVHRDLKPANIMVTKRGRVKVLDFGLAKSTAPANAEETTESLTASGALAGTLPYMAPEQLRHAAVDARTDLYALGVVLYQMATGQRPFREIQAAALAGEILHRSPEPPRTINPALSPHFEAIVLKALRKNADERHQSAEELMAELRGGAQAATEARGSEGLGNLPRPQTGFIGRESEIAEGRRCLASARLLTLTGSGGCGKTRLAIELAESIRSEFPDGTWLVEFASISDPTLVPQTIAAALAVREQPERPIIETLSETLAPRKVLVVLDNCEHLLESAARTAETLVRSCPGLKVLATSRESLRIPGEVSRRVPSLSLPDSGRHGTEILKYEAIRLFVQRATSIVPTFSLTPKNAIAIAEICRRLDGIPLAIELAAARVRLLTPEQIASRLDDSFRLLTAGPRGALARHQTLRAMIDWSYNLLSDTERLLLQRLSVFAGGWTVEAAEAVCVDDPSERAEGRVAISPSDVLDLMTELVEKSLVLVEDQTPKMRCHFLETVRQYALERLEESGEAEATRDRHGDYFLGVATLRDPRADTAETLKSLEREHDNFRAALDRSASVGARAVQGLRMAAALGSFWGVRGYMSEGRTRLSQLLERASDAPPDARVRALTNLGELAWLEARYGESSASYEEGLSLSRATGDKRGMADCFCGLGNVARYTRDFARAREALEESLVIHRELGDRKAVAGLLNNLGAVASNERQIDRAISLYKEALSISREIGDRWGVASRLGNLAEVTMYHGEVEEAAAMHRESLGIWLEMRDLRSIAEGLEMFVETLCAQGRMELAAKMLGAVEALRKAIGCPRPPVDQETIQKALDSARSVLSDQDFNKAWSEGLALSPEEAVAAAMETGKTL